MKTELTTHKIAELVSMGTTPQTVLLAVAVVLVWLPAAKAAIKSRDRDGIGWFVLGVVIGFTGAIFDNIYWGLAWSSDFLELSLTDWLMTNGVYFNILFRQAAGIAAAYCHLRAAEKEETLSRTWTNRALAIANLCGVLYVVFLLFVFVSS